MHNDRRTTMTKRTTRIPRAITRSPRGNAQAGFSLIEIIIVTVLIGAIVAYAASQIFGQSDKAKYNLAKSQVQTLSQKIESYRDDTGELPSSLDDLLHAPGNAQNWLGPYAKEADLKDPWKRAIEYRVPGEAGDFDVISYGADGKPGGESVDGDIRAE
jgi:general secretion pathway protein G